MNDTFSISMNTPMGVKKGTITLTEENGALSGSIRTMGSKSTFRDGIITGNSFEFSGVLNAGFFRFRYHAKGRIEGDTLQATAVTNSGTFQIRGTRVI